MKTTRRIITWILALAMLLSLAACGKKQVQEPTAEQNVPAVEIPATTEPMPAEDPVELGRQDKELVAELIGGTDNATELTDEELDSLVDQLIEEAQGEPSSNATNLSQEQEAELPSVDVTENADAYDENGAMTKPFDQVYPELIEKEQVTFSGESILVKLASDTLTDGLKAAGIGALEKIVPMGDVAWYEAKLTEGTDPESALDAVRQLDEVLLAEFNYEVEVAALDDYKHFDKEQDEEFKKNGHNKDQWHFHYCGIPDGYEEMEYPGGDSSVIVAVIDSGVDYNHEDLKDNMWVNTQEIPDNGKDDDGNGYVDDYYGVDIVAGQGNGDDTNGHGTHVAGIIAARNNNVGVLGIAYNVKIMSVKAAMHNGTLNQADIAKAVLYAYEMGAEVINMSFGGTACSIAVQDALATAYTRCVLVASAGNSGYPNEPADNFPLPLPNYPAALTYVLGVMSVDENGVESSFSNWDARAFNGVEYELYAPGENIMSTLPDNRYGYLSGTSMAAPVVSAFAAILRSEFNDRDTYPTKFIYGQLASTSEIYADCVSPQMHTVDGLPHNLPQVADLNAALTKLPKPEVGVQDYAIFDDPKYSSKNNGDGVIDAGETIALGLTLVNRWGMSENTKVTIDTISDTSGISDPYITIQNPTVNYGSVGTYSTQDCGAVYTGGLHTGWENPFLLTFAENCPNDYRFTLNVTVTCENALDTEDDTVYKSKSAVDENVRNGYVLPAVIDEDMVLTKDNLYIIPNATVIQEGVTVRVEPGTHIQFWSDDADDPYADSYIAYLLVNGKFLAEGTKEEPVYIYPSQLMDDYGVEIGASSSGFVSLKYADITNLFFSPFLDGNHTGTGNRINQAEHCTFRFNYTRNLQHRYLSNGVVYSTALDSYSTVMGHIKAKDCVFYKCGRTSNRMDLYGTFDRCIFNQCALAFDNTQSSYQNCVFLGNSLVDQTNPAKTKNSAITMKDVVTSEAFKQKNIRVYYRPETGTTYVLWDTHTSWGTGMMDAIAAHIRQVYGGDFFVPETMEEYQWVDKNCSYSDSYYTGIRSEEDGYVWNDGTPVQDAFLPINVKSTDSSAFLHIDDDQLKLESTTYALYEIPGQILPEEITLPLYQVAIDTESTYQLAPQNTPVQLPLDGFLYESSDEAVLTVSSTGLVTPVGQGAAHVYVHSLDKAVCNFVTIEVKDYVALEGIRFPAESALVATGEILAAPCVLSPVDTTRRAVVYTSSDERIATVDAGGSITGISSGTATITATCEGITATMEVTVYVKATSLALDNLVLSTSLAEAAVELPGVITNDGAETILSWRVTDETVAALEDGKLVPKTAGTTTLIVTDQRSGLSAACLVSVSETASTKIKQVAFGASSGSGQFVLLENGDLYQWNDNYRTTPTRIATDVVMFEPDSNSSRGLILQSDGSVQTIDNLYTSNIYTYPLLDAGCWDVVEFEGVKYNGYDSHFIRTADGNVYAWGGNNTYGQLGVGKTGAVDTPTLVNLDGVTDIAASSQATWFLTEDGKLYVAGSLSSFADFSQSSVPVCLAEDAAQILYADNCCTYLSTSGELKSINDPSRADYFAWRVDVSQMDNVTAYNTNYEGVGIQDGRVYTFTDISGQLTPVPGISNAVNVVTYDGTHFVVTENGELFGLGANPNGRNRMAGATYEDPVTTPVLIPILPLAEETISLQESTLTNGVLEEDSLHLTFNKALDAAATKLYADGKQVTVQCAVEDYNHLVISRANGFAEDVAYELVFEAQTLRAPGGIVNEEEIRIAFTYVPGGAEEPDVPAPDGTGETSPDETPEEEVIHESQLDETVERILTPERIVTDVKQFVTETQYNPTFHGNVILNPIATDTEVTHWLRPQAPSVSAGVYQEIPLGGNYWGSTNETAIGLQMVDYTDFISYARLMYAPYLTEAPENTFPFVTSVKLFNKYGEEVTTAGNEEITFQVKFNRDMDTSIPLQVRFGSAYPYGDYEVEGAYVNARTWEGKYTLKTFIENGAQFFSISNGCSATEDLELQLDQMRFGFTIDTTAAQSLIMQGTATDTGIHLSWMQDDFDTLMGYNVYRSTKEDGLYTRLNKTVVPAETTEWFDDTVEPGVVYYYNFTVVQSDMAESEPSGKIVIMSKDTMAPAIYHSPVANAFTGANLVVSATVTDNLSIAYANLYYRVAGTSDWSTIRMNKLNDKYSAIIPAQYMTTEGVEYYIEAFDGVSYTYKGSADAPYAIVVQEAISADALGDVDGDGVITNLDALLLLYTINDKYNMTAEEFARADLNGDGELWAAEALRILQYVSGVVGSVKM